MENFINETIDTTGLPQFEEVQFSKLQSSYWNVLVIHKILIFLFWGTALMVAFYFIKELHSYKVAVLLVFMALVLLSFVFSRIGFKKKGFAFRNHDVLFQRGVIATTTTIIPYNRVQHVALEEGPIARYFGLATIKIYTAGTGISGDITIPGIEKGQADKIKQLLMAKIQKQL